MPGMSLIEPYCEREVALALGWALQDAGGPVYLRLVSVPWGLGFEPPPQDGLVEGRGTVVLDGEDALLVAAGPVMVSQAFAAAERLRGDGIRCAVVALPWLRGIDGAWIAELAADAPILCLDNHYASGGQGDALLAALAEASPEAAGRVRKLAVERVPRCGTNDEVLSAHRLDAASVAERVQAELAVRA
jgi:transketolase